MDNRMFCYQCEQTAGCTGCTGAAGVCGKKADTAELQDKLDILSEAVTKDNHAIKEAVAKVVPTYTMKEE